MESTVKRINTRTTTEEILQSNTDVTIINPSPTYFKHVLELLSQHFTTHNTSTNIKRNTAVDIYVSPNTLTDVTDEFIYESVLTELRTTNQVTLYNTQTPEENIVLTIDAAYIATNIDNQIALFSTTDDQTITAISELIDNETQSKVEKSTVKPYTELKNHFAELLNTEFITAFETALTEALNHSDEIPIQHVFVIVSAHETQLQKDVSEGLSDTNTVSIAGFSRAKTELQETGVITTIKVPVDVGRPKHRLQLTDATKRNTDTIRDVVAYAMNQIEA